MDERAQHDARTENGRPARTRPMDDVEARPLRMIRVFAALVLGLAAFASEARAQTRATAGDLRVIAIDESALPLPGVRIAVVHAETGVERADVTGQDGHATVSALPVGRYTMRAEL